MWYLVGFLVVWIGLSWWGVIRADDTEVFEMLETVGFAFLLSLIWPVTLAGVAITYGLFLLVNKMKE